MLCLPIRQELHTKSLKNHVVPFGKSMDPAAAVSVLLLIWQGQVGHFSGKRKPL